MRLAIRDVLRRALWRAQPGSRDGSEHPAVSNAEPTTPNRGLDISTTPMATPRPRAPRDLFAIALRALLPPGWFSADANERSLDNREPLAVEPAWRGSKSFDLAPPAGSAERSQKG